MIKTKKATSIVEVLIIMLIIVIWVVWMYNIFSRWQNLSNTTANRIQAISIAREWLEAMINIRNTNYILYSANYANCWNTLNYDPSCVTTPTNDTTTDILAWSYKIYKWVNNRWYLVNQATWNFSSRAYKNSFRVWIDSDWLYTQTWWTDTKPFFTREIKINYIDTNSSGWWDTNDEKMRVTSLVQWSDSSKSWVLKVELSTVLTNFKNKK